MKIRQHICIISFLFAVLLFSKSTSFAQNNQKFTFQSKGITFVLDRCKMSGGAVLCFFSVTSNDLDREISYHGGGNDSLFDNSGNQYGIKSVSFANTGTWATLVADVPTQMIIQTEDFKSSVFEASLFRVGFSIKRVGNYLTDDLGLILRKIPIVSDSNGNNSNGNNSSNSSSTSANNVAYKKLVYISTNGEEDLSDAGSDCNNPSEIIDGALSKNSGSCANDGILAFQNKDFNQLMEVTITINLKETYDITKIRYNQGDVGRAATWNADFMISPFGKIRTNAGIGKKGDWTEQTGSLTASKVQITFQKTKKKWDEDWLTIGEIEIIGTLKKPTVISKSSRPID